MAPSSKTPLTYSKQNRLRELNSRFDKLTQSTPKQSSSSLPSPTASPRRVPSAAVRTQISSHDDDVFDIPSSDDEQRHQLRLPPTKQHASAKLETSKADLSSHSQLLSLSLAEAQHSHSIPIHPKKRRKLKTYSAASTPNPQINLQLSAPNERLYDSERSNVSDQHPTRPSSLSSTSPPRNIVPRTGLVGNTLKPAPIDVWEVPSSESDSQFNSSKMRVTGKLRDSYADRRKQNSNTKQSQFGSQPGPKEMNTAHQIDGSPSGAASNLLTDEHEDAARGASPKYVSQDITYRQVSPPRAVFEQSRQGTRSSQPSTPKNRSTRSLSSGLDEMEHSPPNSTEHKPSTPHRKGISTPKQDKLWDRLLPEELPVGTPSRHIKLLDLGRTKDSRGTEPLDEQTPRQRRLVDALVPAAQQSSPVDDRLSEGPNSFLDDSQEVVDLDTIPDDSFKFSVPSSKFESVDEDLYNPQEDNRPQPSSQRLTYGGQRTYLEESGDALQDLLKQPLDTGAGLDLPMLGLDPPASGLTVNARKHPRDVDDEDIDGDTPGVRTVFDLKAAGGTELFIDEVNEIADDLNDSKAAISRKRMTILDLHRKLLDSVFRTRVIQHGYAPIIYNKCLAISDTIFGTVTAATLKLILGPEGDLFNPSHLNIAACIAFLSKLLDEPRDLNALAKSRRSNMSKVAQGSVETFLKEILQDTSLKKKGFTQVTPRLLGLMTIDQLIRRLRELGNKDALLDLPLLTKSLDIYNMHMKTAQVHKEGLGSQGELGEVEIILSMLESCTTVAACALDRSIWTEDHLDHLIRLLDSSMLVGHSSIQRLAARLSLNLANGNENNTNMFANGSFIKHLIARILNEFESIRGKKGETLDLDVLLLSLGAMLNLAECSEKARQAVITNDNKQLEALAKTFLIGRKEVEEADSLAAVEANVAYGWLSVLIGNLCRSENIKSRLIKLLPGAGLKPIIDAVDEFISHHKAADRTESGNEAYALFTQRLEGVAELLHALDN